MRRFRGHGTPPPPERSGSRGSPLLPLLLLGAALVPASFTILPAGAAPLPPQVIHTIAGDGTEGFGGDGGPATAAKLSSPQNLAVDDAGAVYIPDTNNNRIRKVDPSGIITTVAGGSTQGFGGDGGPATDAELFLPFGVDLDAGGSLYIADTYAHRIRRIDPSGTITPVAGLAPVRTGNPLPGAYGGDGGQATEALLNLPVDVAVDSRDNLYIADRDNYRVRRVDLVTGVITTVAGIGLEAHTGDGGPAFRAVHGDGRPASQAALGVLGAIDVGPDGSLFISESGHRVRRIVPGADGVVDGDSDETITTAAGGGSPADRVGDGGPAAEARLDSARGVDVDASGNLYIADARRIRRVDAASGVIRTIAGTGADGSGGDGGPATEAQLHDPVGVAVDGAGNVFVADRHGHRVRAVAGLWVALTDPSEPVFKGRPFTYTATVGNASLVPAADATLTDVLPPELSLSAVSPSQGACSRTGARSLSCALGTILPGEAASVAVTVLPAAAGETRNTVRMHAVHPDTLAIDDTDTEPTTVLPPSVFLAGAGSSDPITVGDALTYTFTVTNGLWDSATDVKLVDALPPHVAFRSAAPSRGACVHKAGVVTCALGDLAPGAAATVAIEVLATSAGLVANAARATAANFSATSTAAVETKVASADCGRVITTDTVLQADVGPCAGNGLIVGADGITLDLDGHRVYGFPGPSSATCDGLEEGACGNEAGIRLPMRTGVTVTSAREGGAVEGFDAGLVLMGGGSHTVSNLLVRDNVGPDDQGSFLGDGIVLFNSADNTIVGNRVLRSGHYDGIGVLFPGSDDNTVEGNVVEGTIGSTRDPNSRTGQGIVVLGFDQFPIGDGYIRDIANARVADNHVMGNGSAGISYTNVVGGVISRNTVLNNGRTNVGGNGIGAQVVSLAFNSVTRLLVENNEVHGNAENGIEMFLNVGAQVLNNDAADNDTLQGELFYDLNDRNLVCAGTVWRGNRWGSGGYSDDCTTAEGSGPEASPSGATPPLVLDLAPRLAPPPL